MSQSQTSQTQYTDNPNSKLKPIESTNSVNQAYGFLKGELKRDDGKLLLRTEQGDYEVKYTSDVLGAKLLAMDSINDIGTKIWGVYPIRPKREFKIISLRSHDPDDAQPNQFTIAGRIKKIEDPYISVNILYRTGNNFHNVQQHDVIADAEVLEAVKLKQNWRFECELKHNELRVTSATPLKFEQTKKKKASAKSNENQTNPNNQTNSTNQTSPANQTNSTNQTESSKSIEELTPVSAKIEVTVKFSALPEVAIEGKRVSFKAQTDEGQQVIITTSNKAWKKITAKAEEFPQWVCAANGPIKDVINGVINIDPAGVQIFERKPKAT